MQNKIVKPYDMYKKHIKPLITWLIYPFDNIEISKWRNNDPKSCYNFWALQSSNKPGIYGKVYEYDVNSMYPWIMTKDIPYGHMIDKKPKGKYCEFCECKDGAYLIRPLADFLGKKIIRSVYFKAKPWLKKKMEKLYEAKKYTTGKEREDAKMVLLKSLGCLWLNNNMEYTPAGVWMYQAACLELQKVVRGNKDIIYSMIDGVISLKPLNLDCGNDLGQWKCEEWDECVINTENYYRLKRTGKVKGIYLSLPKFNSETITSFQVEERARLNGLPTDELFNQTIHYNKYISVACNGGRITYGYADGHTWIEKDIWGRKHKIGGYN